MNYRFLIRWDWGLTLGLLALWGLGLLALSSAVQPMGGAGHHILLRQMGAGAIGMIFLALCVFLPPRILERWSPVFFALAILLLIAVLLRGELSHGARRWISIAGIRFQPSEPAKIAMILTLASFLSHRRKRWDRIWPWLQGLLIIIVPTLLVLRQPDLGTASVFPVIGIGMMLIAGMPIMLFFLLLSPFVTTLTALYWPLAALWIGGSSYTLLRRRISLLAVILYLLVQIGIAFSAHEAISHLEPYQKARLNAFVNPEKDPQGAGYQVRQSKIAIGSGEWTGWGYGKGPLKELLYLPRQHTDFIFSVVGEEGGFLATSCILLLSGLLIFRGGQVTRRARDPFVGATAAGVSLFYFYHTAVNISVTVGLLPVTGLPMPFFSSGGSFLISCMAAAGLLLGMSFRKLEY
ncbi:MAG: rod shape-determining protein RodA [Candidatus Eisenbacteria bacterium]|uniref:Rod shape-determining protein RodA n=1 Tax=Eiseniibacteriota bacterium TaxID=2212470 RepID=A0A948RTP5_UNCEI|nr:rod shape-determining protein RodA [Candidatus Eisenbacteria bacterium]MBU1948197.1 rod shape-determining protein RodA [Candidatus Eisenbacteria bacterium]MBU2689806.1 rod shape-determining protein RodA [Candidatus Eisenbacteria bacterium]